MSEIHRYQVVKMITKYGNAIIYNPHGPEVVMAKDLDKRVAELEAELAEAVSLFKLVMDEHPGKERNGNAPGHCHQIPGIWDSDNGAKAGKPCAWCAVWNNAHKFLARHGDKS